MPNLFDHEKEMMETVRKFTPTNVAASPPDSPSEEMPGMVVVSISRSLCDMAKC